MDFKRILNEEFVVFDGAMGTMLQQAGIKAGELPEILNVTNPDLIYNIHKKYINAGADVITTNTFGANRLKFREEKYNVSQVIKKAVEIARKASMDKLVALDIGPIGSLFEPIGEMEFEQGYNIFKEQVIAGYEAGADIIIIETLSDLYEAKAAILAAKENSDLPIICSMTYQENGRTLTGADPITMVNILESLGVDALGINCSLGPKAMESTIEEIIKYSSVPIIVQPNAGLPKVENGKTVYDIDYNEFAEYIYNIANKGASILGGCCGTTPDYIRAIKNRLKYLKPIKRQIQRLTTVTSGTKTVIIDGATKIVGERINPTGKNELEKALKSEELEVILNEAMDQKKAGADILDINTGIPNIDEEKIMRKVVKKIQAIVDLPLQIDSVNPGAIETAVRHYNGKPIINSVNGKEDVMNTIFPIVKKYGTCVIGLTLDENGIPETIEEKLRIAERIIETANQYDIPKENILIDCLALTCSTHQGIIRNTLDAISQVKEKFGVKTTLGISNISYGLPQRQLLNRTFLVMALSSGLDLPIVDPLDNGIIEAVKSYKVLSNQDKNGKGYISSLGLQKQNSNHDVDNREKFNLREAIIDGLAEKAEAIAEKLLVNEDPISVIDNHIIPALDEVSELYEVNEIFLPQLMQSAEAVKKAFKIIKNNIKNKSNLSKGKIALATVTGDIHDIGKGIVKVILENYGYEIIDLGVNVKSEEIIEVIENKGVRLIGLSALMTSTVSNMKKVIDEIKDRGIPCKIMVGGAVLNEEYAKEINADFYAKDPKAAIRIAQKVFKIK
ncbi:homocysteine S-methyltransferase family protein [Sporosalibacterium faouarense]|uniref:homocysteine S-methyltransferase family protein n=1 Tax=Sporosalibacterium faouarense TaxID=516123 RepID=UPI00192AB084|nr:homocysteine S-methyltransferase family protein [Sporosalibacterium faouarense]